MFFRSLALLAVVAFASSAQAATVKFSGNFNFVIGGDVLNIFNKQFLATIETDNALNIQSGQVWLSPDSIAHTQNFLITGGTIAVGPNTTFTANAGGGVLTFTVAGAAPSLTSTNVGFANGTGGTASWVAGGSTYFTLAPITAVPEPSSALAICGLVAGVVGFGRRRRN